MPELLPIHTENDIPKLYRNTPIEKLLQYHNFGKTFGDYEKPELITCMCIDSRKVLRIPQNFSFVIRTGGANIKNIEFKISYLVSLMGIEHIALIGHTDCRMVDLMSRKDEFIRGLVAHAGWTAEQAEKHFNEFAPIFQTGDELEFITSQQKRMKELYPKLTIAPMIYDLETAKLSILMV